MPFAFRYTFYILLACFEPSCPLFSQDDSRWHISPVQINILAQETRPLQLLDDSRHELKGASWTVDNPDLATLTEEDGKMILNPKGVGTIRVTATREGEMRTREVTIWLGDKLPMGTIKWSLKPLGQSLGHMQAVPTDGGPDLFLLSQDSDHTYLQGVSEDGMQVWFWTLPEPTRRVEMVCGDDLGGIILSAQHQDSYTIYAVAKNGKLRWRHTFAGLRMAHALSHENLLHLLNQSVDHKFSTVTVRGKRNGKIYPSTPGFSGKRNQPSSNSRQSRMRSRPIRFQSAGNQAEQSVCEH